MWGWLDSAGAVLFDAALSTTLFLTLVVVAMLVCQQPTRRLLIARFALLASLVMIPLIALVPLPRLDLLGFLAETDILAVPSKLELATGGWAAVGSTAIESDTDPLVANGVHTKPLARARWLARGLTSIYLVFVSAGIAWVLLGCWGVRWLIRHSFPPSAASREILGRLLAEGPPRRFPPVVCVAPRVQRPVIVGLVRPTILIPSVLDDPGSDSELLRLSLLHEIAHGDQADPTFGVIASLSQAIWFFLPQVWWLRSRMIIDQEFLADRFASLRYGTSSAYASSLLSLAKSQPSHPAEKLPSTTGTTRHSRPAEGRSPLSQRVLMLLNCPFLVEARAPRSWSWMLRISLVIAMVSAACLCIRWPNASALEHNGTRGPLSDSSQFFVTDFTTEPVSPPKLGRAISYVMPVALPPQFELSVEVLSTLADLEKLSIAGHSLREATLRYRSFCTSDPAERHESWQSIRLERRRNRISIEINGHSSAFLSSPRAETEWLTFEPGPDQVTHFRNLVVK